MVDNPVKEQYKVISDMSDKNGLSAIRDVLSTGKYSPSGHIDILSDEFLNPGVDMYFQRHNWTDSGWDNIYKTGILSKCPEYLPSENLIRYLTERDSILEIGSGSGYWSYVINQNGGDCLPTDISPQDISYEDIPKDVLEGQTGSNFPRLRDAEESLNNTEYPYDLLGDDDNNRLIWSKVATANHTCISEIDREYVLVCHPSQFVWTQDVLDLVIEEDKKLILVAEWCPGMDATPATFLRLDRRWETKEKFNVIDWQGMNVGAYVMKPPNSKADWRTLIR